MNQRDQNRHQRSRHEQQGPKPGPRGQRQGRYGAMPGSEAMPRQPSRSRFTDTYNPEPQWLREDEPGSRYGQPLAGGGYDRDDEDYRGGRHAFAGRGQAGQARGGFRAEERGYGEERGRQGYGRPGGATGYGREIGEDYAQGPGRWDGNHPEPGEYQGAQADDGRFEGEYRSHGGSRYPPGGRASAYRTGYGPGYGPGYGSQAQRWRSGSQFASDYGAGGYDQVAGSPGYRGRGGYATGDYQSGMEGQRSYRGFGPQSYRRSDDRIRDDVCERLTDDPRIDASNVTIDVNQGAVTLGGTVPERYMRYAAEDLVDDAMGVESINNQLRVQRQGTPSGGDAPMAAGSRGSAPSDLEKQKH